MGTTDIPIGKMKRNMSLLWKLLAIIVIIQATGINAKQIQNDLTFDDTFDIDQFDDVASAKLRSAHDLDEKAFIEDELQPVEDVDSETAANNDGSWLMQSVKRVRRELGRLFGSEEKSINANSKKNLKHHKKHGKSTKSAGGVLTTTKSKSSNTPQPRSGGVITITKAKGNRKLNKRQSFGIFEGSGDDNEQFDEEAMDTWQTIFIINEPWREEYRQGKSHQVFMELQQQIVVAFNYHAAQFYGDEDNYLNPILLRVEPTDDMYKIYCVVQVELPEKWSSFGKELQHHLTKYKTLGTELSGDIDSKYYFRRVRDIQDHESVDVTTDFNQIAHNNGEGSDNNINHVGAGEEGHHYNTGNQRYSECDSDGIFHCHNGQRIDCAFLCDNNADCEDDTDEEKEMCDKYFQEHDQDEDEVEEEDDNEVVVEAQPNYGDAVTNKTPYEEETDYNYEREERERQEREREIEKQRQLEQEEREERERQLQQEREHQEREQQERERQQHEQQQREREQQERERELEEERERNRVHNQDEEHTVHNEEVYDCNANPDGEFMCHNGETLPCYLHCDGQPHCSDNSDEEECFGSDTPTEATPIENDTVEHREETIVEDGSGYDEYPAITETSPVYTPNYGGGCRGDTSFTCSISGVTICEEVLCDGHEDCPDGEDEENCGNAGEHGGDDEESYETVCRDDEFKCDGNRCLPKTYQCNGYRECGDGTDEENCPEKGELF